MSTAILLAVLLILPVCWSVAYRRFFHGLAAVPGPRLAAVTGLWYAYQVRRGQMLHLAQTLHKQYGPVVRVGPDELWFDSTEAFKLIYSTPLSPLPLSPTHDHQSVIDGRMEQARVMAWTSPTFTVSFLSFVCYSV